MFSKLRNYVKQYETKLYYIRNKLNIINYKNILVFENNKILVECLDDILEVKGEDLVINKLLNDELLIEGKIISISFRGYNV